MNIARPSIRSSSLLSRGRVAALGLACAALAGCSSGPTIVVADHSPNEVVEWFNANNESWSGFSLKSLLAEGARHTGIVQKKCFQMGGTNAAVYGTSPFIDRTGAIEERMLPRGTFCALSDQPSWGITTSVVEGTLVPGTAPSYSGRFFYTLMSPDEVQSRLRARELARQKALDQNIQCQAEVAHRTQLLNVDPRVGMQTHLGVAIDVRAPLVLIQYKPELRQGRGRDTEWIHMRDLRSALTCAVAR